MFYLVDVILSKGKGPDDAVNNFTVKTVRNKISPTNAAEFYLQKLKERDCIRKAKAEEKRFYMEFFWDYVKNTAASAAVAVAAAAATAAAVAVGESVFVFM